MQALFLISHNLRVDSLFYEIEDDAKILFSVGFQCRLSTISPCSFNSRSFFKLTPVSFQILIVLSAEAKYEG